MRLSVKYVMRLLSAVILLAGAVFAYSSGAYAGECSPHGASTITDPNTGQSWSAVSDCNNDGGATMYMGPNNSTPTAYMDSTTSWFVCYFEGDTHEGGNNIWYYSQGDRSISPYQNHQAWGYMKAWNVWTTYDPSSSHLPRCAPDMWQRKLSVTDSAGRQWSTVWYGQNPSGAPLYVSPGSTHVSGYMDSTTSWFVCYALDGAGKVWYYTEGDRTVDGQLWGYMPSTSISGGHPHPYGGVPACAFTSSGGGGAPISSPDPVPARFFPVRAKHLTGLNTDRVWSCNGDVNQDPSNSSTDDSPSNYVSQSDFSASAGHLGVDIGAVGATPFRYGTGVAHDGVTNCPAITTTQIGASVVATVDGTVTQVTPADGTLGGNRITIQDAYGWSHYYAHLSDTSFGSFVSVGQHVAAGTLLGYVGHTGGAGCVDHLHYSIYKDDYNTKWYGSATGDNQAVWRFLNQVEHNVCTDWPLGLPPPEGDALQSCGYATIWNSPSNRAIEVSGGSTFNTAKVQTWDYRTPASGSTDQQHWVVESAGTGSNGQALFTIVNYNALRAGTRMCLDASAPGAGSTVYLYQCTGADNQKWYSSGTHIQSYLGGKCLDTKAASTSIKDVDNGTGLQLSDCRDELDQSWSMECTSF